MPGSSARRSGRSSALASQLGGVPPRPAGVMQDPYEAIEKTLGTRLEAGESSDDFVRRAVAAAELGIEHLGVITAGAWRPEALTAAIRQLREVRPPQTPSTAP
jgi:hypothetical protein